MLLVLPIVLPLGTAIVLLLLRDRRLAQRVVAVVSGSALVVVALALAATVWTAGPQVIQSGNWPAPFGISLVADLFSAGMNVVVASAGLLVAIYSLASIERKHERFGYFPIYFILLAGVAGAFLTGDLFNLYVWFEVLLIASFVLMALGNERNQLEGAMKYVVLSLISSLFFLTACGLMYGMVGTLNMADIAAQLPRYPNQALVVTLGMLFFLAFGIKAAAFPVFSWLPASYHTPPVAVSGIFAALLTKVGVYALIRVFTLLFT
ncbi:MAG: Na+/H+ antiporter subunit D, partial [Dehalococcoidia bacterium]|nr:Na+/H+ antiporter subunit D [Dehalococcoidia bacterium]